MAKTMLFNPYTGKPRDPRDIASDPAGVLMIDPDEPLSAAKPTPEAEPAQQALIDWVVGRWYDEVSHRPMVNVHRRSLDDAWRQMLRHLGVDDRARLGPTHDELRAKIGSKEWEAMNATPPAEKQAAPSGENDHG